MGDKTRTIMANGSLALGCRGAIEAKLETMRPGKVKPAIIPPCERCEGKGAVLTPKGWLCPTCFPR